MSSYDLEKTAVVLIGYQNDYFADDGILRGAIEESSRTNNVLANTVALLEKISDRNVLIGAPTGSGKTVAAELALLRMLRERRGAACDQLQRPGAAPKARATAVYLPHPRAAWGSQTRRACVGCAIAPRTRRSRVRAARRSPAPSS